MLLECFRDRFPIVWLNCGELPAVYRRLEAAIAQLEPLR
jgi:hypothetical protein